MLIIFNKDEEEEASLPPTLEPTYDGFLDKSEDEEDFDPEWLPPTSKEPKGNYGKKKKRTTIFIADYSSVFTPIWFKLLL